MKSICLSKKFHPRKVHAVEEEEEGDIHFLGEIGCDKNYWSAQIGVNGRTTRFKLDTRAAVTVLSDECHITLRPDAKPFCLYDPRKIPHPLIPKVKNQIETMLQQGVISPVTAPTEWCSGIVPVLKTNGSVRICVDLTHHNKAVHREIQPIPSVDENLAKLGYSKIFSKLDANSGFCRFPLDDKFIPNLADLSDPLRQLLRKDSVWVWGDP